MGIGRTFQNIRLFDTMSAVENVLSGMHTRLKGNILGSIFSLPGTRREEREARDRAAELLDFAGIEGTGGLRQEPLLRGPAEAGDSQGPGLGPQAPAPGRADGRHEPAGDGAADGPHREAARGAGDRRAA